MENLDKAFMPGYITTSLNGKVIEVVKAEVTEAEQKMVGNYHKTVLRTYKNNIKFNTLTIWKRILLTL